MKDVEEIKIMLKWLEDDESPEPETMPKHGWVWDRDQAIEILDWILY